MPLNTLKSLDVPKITFKYLEVTGSTLKYPEVFWITLKYPRVPWNTLKVYWIALKYPEVPWNTLKDPEVPWSALKYRELPHLLLILNLVSAGIAPHEWWLPLQLQLCQQLLLEMIDSIVLVKTCLPAKGFRHCRTLQLSTEPPDQKSSAFLQ